MDPIAKNINISLECTAANSHVGEKEEDFSQSCAPRWGEKESAQRWSRTKTPSTSGTLRGTSQLALPLISASKSRSAMRRERRGRGRAWRFRCRTRSTRAASGSAASSSGVPSLKSPASSRSTRSERKQSIRHFVRDDSATVASDAAAKRNVARSRARGG